MSDEDIVKQARRYGIPSARVYRMDTALFRHISNDKLSQALFQPAQIRLYDGADTLRAILANCHVGGFPNLKWKRSGWADRFPPYSAVALDSTVLFTTDVPLWKPVGEAGAMIRESGRPVVVLVWTRFLGRQTKRMIRYSEELWSTWPETDRLYINADDLFLGAEF